MKCTPVLVVVALLLCACGGSRSGQATHSRPPADQLPIWVRTTPRIPGVLRGVGSGPDRDAALAAARAEVLAQLRVSIDSVRDERTRIEEQRTHDSVSGQLRRSVDETVKQQVSFDDVPGLTPIREHQHVDGETYVMAELELAPWAEDLRVQLADVDQRLATKVEAWPVAKEPVDDLIYGRQVVPLLVERTELVDLLRAVDSNRPVADSQVDLAAVEERLAAAMRATSLVVQVQGLDLNQVPDLISALASRGVPVVPQVEQAAVQLQLQFEEQTRRFGQQLRVDGSISGALIRRSGGQRLDGIRVSSRAAGTDASIARNRLIEKLSPALAQAVERSLFGLPAAE